MWSREVNKEKGGDKFGRVLFFFFFFFVLMCCLINM